MTNSIKTVADLAPKNNKPNCVSSAVDSGKAAIKPLNVTGKAAKAWVELKNLLESQPRMKVISADETSMHATDTSKLLRFVDDIEFLLDGDVIHVRSASRLGYSDFGVNRKRVELLREQLNSRLA